MTTSTTRVFRIRRVTTTRLRGTILMRRKQRINSLTMMNTSKPTNGITMSISLTRITFRVVSLVRQGFHFNTIIIRHRNLTLINRNNGRIIRALKRNTHGIPLRRMTMNIRHMTFRHGFRVNQGVRRRRTKTLLLRLATRRRTIYAKRIRIRGHRLVRLRLQHYGRLNYTNTSNNIRLRATNNGMSNSVFYRTHTRHHVIIASRSVRKEFLSTTGNPSYDGENQDGCREGLS